MSIDIYGITNEVRLKRYYEPKPGLFIAESPNVVERALNAGYEPESFLIEEKLLKDKEKLLISQYPDVPVYLVDEEQKKKITGYPMTRGMLSCMKRKPLPGVEIFLESVLENSVNKQSAHSRIVILENVVNPTNIGAIFRSAAALGIDAVLLTSGCCDPLYRRAIRVSMGTVFQIPWTYFDDQNGQWIDTEGEMLRNKGFKLVSMALKNDTVDIDNPALANEEKLAIIMGTEGEGLDEYTIQNSDMTVKIPMAHGVDSLNVAAASAIAFWQLR